MPLLFANSGCNFMKYQCTITGGDGSERNGGIWEKKETDKMIYFKYADDLHFEPLFTLIKIRKIDNNSRDMLRDWDDGTYTAYPKQCGTPYYFEPI